MENLILARENNNIPKHNEKVCQKLGISTHNDTMLSTFVLQTLQSVRVLFIHHKHHHMLLCSNCLSTLHVRSLSLKCCWKLVSYHALFIILCTHLFLLVFRYSIFCCKIAKFPELSNCTASSLYRHPNIYTLFGTKIDTDI